MSSSALYIEETFEQAESYNVDFRSERKLSFWENIMKWYADSLHGYFDSIKSTTYSPFSISSIDAAKYLKKAQKYHAQFSFLAKKFEEIKDESPIASDIYNHLNKISIEFEYAMDYLSDLSDPVKHAKIKESIDSLYTSNFIED